ncbi:PWWP domain-containing protein 3-like [Salvia hispanica]|uniref:PWWP domain-containing protein 3-like n=1 Tax=Salvia hispanica TaxID=49212 RepID=UPI002009429D|nr:PWWP domain-containing protein 3-like [Salvia hispanica]
MSSKDSQTPIGGSGRAGPLVAMKDHGGSAAAVNTERRLITFNGNGNVGRVGYGRWNGELLEDQDHGFRAGDLVWAKIKSQPWWPAQVYDPRDASELALKHSREGCVLVCFFGEDSCSWCLPVQLVPLVENLDSIWSERPSRSFEKAVHRAFDEIGRLMESKILCRCISLEKRGDLARPVAKNVGVKAGLLVPEVDFDRLPIPQYEPADIRAKLVRFARTASFGNVLDLTVLRSWISAYSYAECGGRRLAAYSEPVLIEELEDSRVVSPFYSPEPTDDVKKVYKRKRLRTAIGGGFKDDRLVVFQPNEIESKAEPSTARERKKSKYLSPPYTNLNEIGYKPWFEMRKSSFLEELDDEKASEKDKMASLASDVEVEVNELMLRLKSAAVDRFYLRNEGHLDSICSFASAYRSSTYLHGAHFKTYLRCKKVSSRKRKKLTGSPKVLRLTAPAHEPTDSLVLDARLIGKRVDSMAKMLESCVSKFSSDDKARLREEMNGLIEKVEVASDKVRLIAEKSSS